MTMTKMKSAVAIASLLALVSSGEAQQNAPLRSESLGELDCVIEAKMMIKLGSPDTGIMETVKVDRGQTVKKGETVAQLDSELQRLAVELAQVNSERKRLTYRSSEAERALALYAQCLGDGPEKFPMVGISMGGEL